MSFIKPEITAFAATGASTVNQSANYASSIIRAVSVFFNPLCVLSVGSAIIQIVVTNDSRTAQGAIKFIKMAVLSFAIFNCLGALIAYVDNLGIAHFYNFSAKNISDLV